MEEKSWRRNHGWRIRRRTHAGEISGKNLWRTNLGGSIMEAKITQGEIEEDKSPRGNHGGAMMEENSWR
jgi:hypothetical protein